MPFSCHIKLIGRYFFLLLLTSVVHPSPVLGAPRGTPGTARTIGRVVLSALPGPSGRGDRRHVPPPRALPELTAGRAEFRTPGTLLWKGPAPDSGPSPKISSILPVQSRHEAITPPDVTGALGPQHLVTVTNEAITVHTRKGQLLQNVDLNGFWHPTVSYSTYCGDPRIAYDPHTDRWFMVAMAISKLDAKSTVVLANSETADPTGPGTPWGCLCPPA